MHLPECPILLPFLSCSSVFLSMCLDPQKRSVEDLKERYYHICAKLANVRAVPGTDLKIPVFDAGHERRRKEQLERLYNRTPEQVITSSTPPSMAQLSLPPGPFTSSPFLWSLFLPSLQESPYLWSLIDNLVSRQLPSHLLPHSPHTHGSISCFAGGRGGVPPTGAA